MNTQNRAAVGLLIALAATSSAATHAHDAIDEDGTDAIDEVVVRGVRDRLYRTGALKDVIQKTEVVDQHIISGRQAVNLTQAIAASPGVRVSNECSMCGVKRIMLNGMRGEHTTILVDGMPLHTMLAGYYAVDAIATAGVSRIEVARGAGASLIAPEAIGGTVNIVSREAERSGVDVNASVQDGNGYLVSSFASLVSRDGRQRLSVVAQADQQDRFDSDGNGVSEAPIQDNRSIVLRWSGDLSDRDNVVVRTAFVDSEIFGGPMDRDDIGSVLRDFDGVESERLFVNDDVREAYLGAPWETTEWISTERIEASANWLHEFNGRYNTVVSVGYAEHTQDSFYEGFDYRADDELTYLDFRNNLAATPNHFLTFGIDRRDEQMRSDSDAGAASDVYIEDSFDYTVTGLYLQDTWTPSDRLEIALAARLDAVKADFVAVEKPGTEIDRTIFAPRVDARYKHSAGWSSRFSVGRGYRAPLSFFETDHGILDAGDGFAIDVDRLEESLSTAYALSYEGERLTGTLSLAHTQVDNLAAIDETEDGVPLLTQLDEQATVFSTDVALSYRITDAFTVSGTAEWYDYDTVFRSSYAIAPAEERATVVLDYSGDKWMAYATAIWTGERDLSRYGYEGFDVFDSLPKATIAEAFVTVDVKVERAIGERASVYIGAFNLFDDTQAGNGQSPLFWDSEGAYDVAYIHGALRGRQVFVGTEFGF